MGNEATKIKVNPRKKIDKDGKEIIFNAYDSVGRKLKWKPEGNFINKTLIVSRQLKDGDLVLVRTIEEVKAEEKKLEIEKKTKKTILKNKEV